MVVFKNQCFLMSILDHSGSVCPSCLAFDCHTLGFAQGEGKEGKKKRKGKAGRREGGMEEGRHVLSEAGG